MTDARVISVSELNRLARQTLESQLPLLWVSGEISNLTRAASGHIYFTLKDSHATVRGVMFRSRAHSLDWQLQNGDSVEAQAVITLYEPRGDFQINVETMRRAGAGNLYERFLQLKEKLGHEGLFAPEHKRSLPDFPRCIGIITSSQAAALSDVVTTLNRRSPHVSLILYPCTVQGVTAPREIIAAIETANRRAECDLLILCRGGGSLEDLWAFNDEQLARIIRSSTLPIISGIGHETDFTIADFVADLRAPTPTAAAEMAAPERYRLASQLAELRQKLFRSAVQRIGKLQQQIDLTARRLKHPAERIQQQRAYADALRSRLGSALRHQLGIRRLNLAEWTTRLNRNSPDLPFLSQQVRHIQKNLNSAAIANLTRHHNRLNRLADRLFALDPKAVLTRGYSLTTNAQGKIIKNTNDTELGEAINVHLASGRLTARVEERHPTPETQQT